MTREIAGMRHADNGAWAGEPVAVIPMIETATVSTGPSGPGPSAALGIRPRKAACVAIARTSHPASSAQGARFSTGLDIGLTASLLSVRSPPGAR